MIYSVYDESRFSIWDYGIFASSILLVSGWVLSFFPPRFKTFAFTMKSLGILFLLLPIFTVWTRYFYSPPETVLPDYGLAFLGVSLILLSPIFFSLFWIGIINDSIPTFRRIGFYIKTVLPFIILYFLTFIGFAYLAYGLTTIGILIIFIGLFPMLLAIIIYLKRKTAEETMEMDEKRLSESDERELMEDLSQSGFKG